MNNVARQKLFEIIARHGPEITNSPRRCEGLLRDYVPELRREIAVLVNALEERVARDLLAANTKALPREVLLTRLAKRLHDDVAMEETAARWAVGTWALALGVSSADELAEWETQEAMAATPPAQTAKTSASASAHATHQTALPSVAAAPTAANVKARNIIVSAAGDGDFLSINEAVRRAGQGARITVRSGLYRESVTIDRSLEIIGDGAPETIIIENAAASCLTMRAVGPATVRNLTMRVMASLSGSAGFFAVDILQGELTLEDCDITSDALSCIALRGAEASAVIRRCYIHHSADSGIYALEGARGQVEDCLIEASRNVGVAITTQAALALARCRIQNGENAGVVAWNEGSATLEACELSGNRKANVGVSEAGQLSARNCHLHSGDNSGVFVHQRGRATFEACEIFNHIEAEAAITSGGQLVLRSCQIHDGQLSGVFVRDEGRVLVDDCDVYANQQAGIEVQAGGVAAIHNSRINGNGTVAIQVETGGEVEALNNDLTGNQIAAWETNYDTLIESRGNEL